MAGFPSLGIYITQWKTIGESWQAYSEKNEMKKISGKIERQQRRNAMYGVR